MGSCSDSTRPLRDSFLLLGQALLFPACKKHIRCSGLLVGINLVLYLAYLLSVSSAPT